MWMGVGLGGGEEAQEEGPMVDRRAGTSLAFM